MKPEFSNLSIQFWRHTDGRLGHATLCICAQAAGAAIDSLIAATNELRIAGPNNQRKLTTTANQRSRNFTTARLCFREPADDFSELWIGVADSTFHIEFTENGFQPLRDALQVWRDGGEDFCIYPRGDNCTLQQRDRDSGELWFWTPQTDP